MARRFWNSLLKWSAAVLMLAGLLAAAYTINHWMQQKRAPAAESDKKRAANGIVKLGTELAESHGVKDEPAVPVVWYQRVRVYGRVVPNPQATVEVRSPFAGTLRADPACAWPTPGRWVRAGQVLGHVDIRAGPQERLDLQAKLAEARAKQAGAEEVLKIQKQLLDRLQEPSTPDFISRKELDEALKSMAEARMQLATAKAAAQLWQKALDALQNRGDRPVAHWSEPLTAAADGEVTELKGRPGMAIEAGGAIACLVDFRRPLIRLELPPEVLAAGPPPTQVDLFAVPVAVQPLGSPQPMETCVQTIAATLIGPAGHVDALSQFAAYWYEVQQNHSQGTGPDKESKANAVGPGGLAWRPGLFVQADLKIQNERPQQAVSVPHTALLLHQGRTLVYVRTEPGRFERREVRALGRQGDRWVLASGVAAGEPVVFRRAQVLLSEEFRGDVDND